MIIAENCIEVKMKRLLLEIGTEEIPAGYIEPALDALASQLKMKMDDARIDYHNCRTLATPRRLTVIFDQVSEKQASETMEVTGPPASVGCDENGNWTIAAQKFAEKMNVPVKSLFIKESSKGSYICVKKTEEGLATPVLLKSIFPQVIGSVPFPKTMRWADLSISFARPILSILALFGDTVVSFSLETLQSDRLSFGHRFVKPERIEVPVPERYVDMLKDAHVIVDSMQRKQMISEGIAKAAREKGGMVLPDDDLLDTVTHLVEYPHVVIGKYDQKFLDLPREILITAMREHQKYFAVVDAQNKLMPFFITISNTPAKDMGLVAVGNERVLRARLEDARFFYQTDLKVSMEEWVDKLQHVLFQAKLGSVYEKVIRVRKITKIFAQALDPDPEFIKHACRAALLCKADLLSQVVVEFTKLQGIMGRVYAGAAGESERVAFAIEEHYKPTYSGGPLPETKIGAILSIADKIDSICGFFSVGLIPTGASDPYALRRQGIGVLQIMRALGFEFSLQEMIDTSLALFDTGSDDKLKETGEKVFLFLKNRMSHLLEEEGFSKDIIAAILAVDANNIPNILNRVQALEALKAQPDFEPLAVAFKRVVNIIKKTESVKTQDVSVEINEDLFEDKSEHALFAAYQKAKTQVSEHIKKKNFEQALLDIAALRDAVDQFFDGVLVMAEDMALRTNRLALLKKISALFEMFADFSKISV
jgi:glycyl-tRNA synthetase beta chain